MCAGISSFGFIIFTAFAKGEEQPWAKVVVPDATLDVKVSSQDIDLDASVKEEGKRDEEDNLMEERVAYKNDGKSVNVTNRTTDEQKADKEEQFMTAALI